MDKKTNNVFIRIISDFIKCTHSTLPQFVDLLQLYELAAKNGVTGILYYQLKDTILDKSFLTKLENDFLFMCSDSITKDIAAKELSRLFSSNSIDHIFLKGSFLKKLYPVSELRTMGDIDILIRADDNQKVKKLLAENGYFFDAVESYSKVWNYKKNGVLFEIHSAIIYENFNPDIDVISFFSNTFTNSFLLKNSEYIINTEYNFIYILTHLAKHYYSGGAGIKMFMDLSLFIKKYGADIDVQYIKEQTSKLKLYTFLCLVSTLCNRWFETKNYFDKYDASEEFLDQIELFVLNGGVFGKYNENHYANKILLHKKTDMLFFKSIISYLFPTDSHMRTWCKWYENKPKILLPVSWIYRFFVVLLQKKEGIFSHMLMILKSSKKLNDTYNFLKKSGLIE